MIDLERFEVVQVLTSNRGTPTQDEHDRVVRRAMNENTYYMPGIHFIHEVNSRGDVEEFRLSLGNKRPAQQPEFIPPVI